jgi:hypothetical protein
MIAIAQGDCLDYSRLFLGINSFISLIIDFIGAISCFFNMNNAADGSFGRDGLSFKRFHAKQT